MAKGSAGFWKRTSIQVRVRTALIGVLLLTAPQVGLTLYYLADLSEAAHSVHQRVNLIMALTEAELQADGLEKQSEQRLTHAQDQQSQDSLSRWFHEIEALAMEHPEAQLSSLVQAAEAIKQQWKQRTLVEPAPDPIPGVDATLGGVVLKEPELEPLDWTPVHVAFRDAFVHSRDQLKSHDAVVGRIFDKASRNLVSLTILAFIFVAALIVMLPARLVRPLRHITEVIRQAAEGKYGVNVQIDSHDEVGKLAQAFQRTMERVHDFDERKKDRIVEDGAKIEALIRQMPMAAAILNRRYVVEVANPAFDALFERNEQDVDQAWPNVFMEGSDNVRNLLDSVVQHRESLKNQTVVVQGSTGEKRLKMSIDYCRDRTGKVGFVLVLVHGE